MWSLKSWLSRSLFFYAVLLHCITLNAIAAETLLRNIPNPEERLVDLLRSSKQRSAFNEAVGSRVSPLASPHRDGRNGRERVSSGELPVVMAHGMGDSCFNPGMASITSAIGSHLSVYSTCIGDGDSQLSDTVNGFLLNMDGEVDYFAQKVRADPKLKGGFKAMGFSQGNLVIRGYIQRYNDPPVKSFISMHGPMMGVASIPHCNPSKGIVHKLCQEMVQLLSVAAYSSVVQKMLAQANYLRDPEDIKGYLTTSFLPDLNNEIKTNETLKTNFASLEQLVLVKASADTMIFPKESEWFGVFQDGGYEKLLTMHENPLYISNSFGLKSLDEAGKVHFETTAGDHLQFTSEELFGIVRKYWQSEGITEFEI